MERLAGGASEEPDSVTAVILERVAAAEGVETTDLSSLYDVLDPDALERLVLGSDAAVEVTFEYSGWVVNVGEDEGVEIPKRADDGRIYRWVCHTCEESDVVEDLASAQAQFTEHAQRECEVVLRNVRSNGPEGVTETARTDCRFDESRAADE